MNIKKYDAYILIVTLAESFVNTSPLEFDYCDVGRLSQTRNGRVLCRVNDVCIRQTIRHYSHQRQRQPHRHRT